MQRKACSDEAANSFDVIAAFGLLSVLLQFTKLRTRRVSHPGQMLLMHRTEALQVRPGTGFRSHRSLPAERGGDRCRFSEGGHSRCGYAGFACRGPAAQYDICGLPDRNAGASLRRGSVYRGFHHECGGQRVRPRGCHHR